MKTGSLAAIVCVVATCSVPLFAQTETPTDMAARLFHEGRAAYSMRKVDAARMAFEKAFNLVPTPQIAYNLGITEYETGRFVLAARHIAHYVRQKKDATPAERKALLNAERYVAGIAFDVSVQGARVFVDDEDFGLTPFLSQPRYVAAGRHTIRVTCDGFESVEQVHDLDAGKVADVKITLHMDQKPREIQPVPPTVLPPTKQDLPLPAQRSFWTEPRTIVIGSGVALTVAAGVFTAIEAVRAADFRANAEGAPSVGIDECAQSGSPACSQRAELERQYQSANDLKRIGMIGTAVLGGITAITVATWSLWPAAGVRVAPGVGSVHVLGSFE